jgi:hypothetical protein
VKICKESDAERHRPEGGREIMIGFGSKFNNSRSAEMTCQCCCCCFGFYFHYLLNCFDRGEEKKKKTETKIFLSHNIPDFVVHIDISNSYTRDSELEEFYFLLLSRFIFFLLRLRDNEMGEKEEARLFV